MDWLNIWGLFFVIIIMILNIVFAIKCNDGFENNHVNKIIESIEQIGRYGCLGFMIFNVPGTWFGWWSIEAFAIYLIVDAMLIALYCILWILCWKKNSVFKALALSATPRLRFCLAGL